LPLRSNQTTLMTLVYVLSSRSKPVRFVPLITNFSEAEITLATEDKLLLTN